MEVLICFNLFYIWSDSSATKIGEFGGVASGEIEDTVRSGVECERGRQVERKTIRREREREIHM